VVEGWSEAQYRAPEDGCEHGAIIATLSSRTALNEDTGTDAGGVLWIVATPIGSAEDLAPRAREVLESVDSILAEDTRRTRALLARFEIKAGRRLVSFHEHNQERVVPRAMAELTSGASLALVCDAGTPVLSDPGFTLVHGARGQGVRVLSCPGPSAFTAALAASGQPALPATLVGFLPARPGPRRQRVAELAVVPWSLVVLLSPHRLGAELEDLAAGLGRDRRATLLAELSKVHERGISGTLAELASCQEVERPRGEYVVVLAPPPDRPAGGGKPGRDEVERAYAEALAAGLPRREALRAVARDLGVSRREVYALLHDASRG